VKYIGDEIWLIQQFSGVWRCSRLRNRNYLLNKWHKYQCIISEDLLGALINNELIGMRIVKIGRTVK
jgi:hypothetical protein